MSSLRYPFLYLFLLAFFPALASAQVWRSDFSSEGKPAEHWRYDRSSYTISGGALHLTAPQSPAKGTAALVTNVTLPQQIVWRGQVEMDLFPSATNYATILLCAVQALDATSYEYVALTFGQGGDQRISLRRIKVSKSPTTPTQLRLTPLTSPLISSSVVLNASGRKWDYEVRYSPESGWRLALRDVGIQSHLELIGEEDSYLPSLPEKNTFGICCSFTSAHHEGWHFRKISIIPDTEDTEGHPEAPDQPRPTPTPTPPEGVKAGLLLSEVMTHPKPDSPEYIELYNASDTSCDLSDYALATGRNGIYKVTPLPAHRISARAYVVVTKDPDALSATYPKAPRETFVQVALPHLLNQAGVIGLLTKDELVLDFLHYSNALRPKGMKNKAGIALERSNFQVHEEAGNWHIAAQSAGFATPGEKNSTPDVPTGAEPKTPSQRVSAEELFTLLDSAPEGLCTFTLYRLTGELVARGTSLARESWVQTLRTNPTEALRSIVGSTRTPLLLHIQLIRSDKTEAQASLLFQLLSH
jgi:hypothetical protein